jgi:hypothetical protein
MFFPQKLSYCIDDQMIPLVNTFRSLSRLQRTSHIIPVAPLSASVVSALPDHPVARSFNMSEFSLSGRQSRLVKYARLRFTFQSSTLSNHSAAPATFRHPFFSVRRFQTSFADFHDILIHCISFISSEKSATLISILPSGAILLPACLDIIPIRAASAIFENVKG